MTTIYPRFIGIDGNGDYVWELADGRWTWGNDPYDAAARKRTFTPDRYVDKYGDPVTLTNLPTRLRELRPESVTPAAAPEPAEDPTTPVTNHKAGAHHALVVTLQVLDEWIRGAKENHEALEHRGREGRGKECWRSFAPSDIRHMINDAARELGLAEFAAPADPEEDKAL